MFERLSKKPDDGFSNDPERRQRQIDYLESVKGRAVADNLGVNGGPNFSAEATSLLHNDEERTVAQEGLHALYEEVMGRRAKTGSFIPEALTEDFDQ